MWAPFGGPYVFPRRFSPEPKKEHSLTAAQAVVVLPSSAEEVSAAVRFANAHSLRFAVRGGGHSTAGASSAQDGMVIDLGLLRAVAVDPAARTVRFGGGCLWADVDAACWAHGLATPGGTVSHTGVGGLILGGGFGFLSSKHGLTIDALVAVDLVLADGSRVTADAERHPDLFWAARGAGAAFAVATSFTSRVFPQGRAWAGPLLFPPARVAEVVAATNEVLAGPPAGTGITAGIGFIFSPPPERHPVLAVVSFYDGPRAEAEEVFAPLLRLGPLAVLAEEVDYPVVNTLANAQFEHGARYQFGAANIRYPMDAAVVQAAADAWYAGVEEMSADSTIGEDMRGAFVLFEGVPNAKIREVAPDATAFANRGEYFNVALGTKSTDPKNDGVLRAFRRRVAAIIRDGGGFAGDEVGGRGVGQYNNYVEESMSAETAFGGNARRLMELKAKYDPLNRFDKSWRLAPVE